MSKQEPSGEAPANISGSQGVFLGSGNQFNSWEQNPRLDAADVRDVNPHRVVAWLQKKEHDELVKFFAGAAPGDVGEVLDVLYEVDLAKLTAVLADIKPRKATELIEGSRLDPRLFAPLPEASQEISRFANMLGWVGEGPVNIYADGYERVYSNGHVFWSRESGTRRTVGAIDRYYTTYTSRCGFLVGDQEAAPAPAFNTVGIRQRFRLGTVYSSKIGTFMVTDGTCYEEELGSGGWLGLPIGELEENGGFGKLQRFQGGVIYSYEKDGPKSFAVVQQIVEILPGYRKCRPISRESDVKSLDKVRTIQRFELEGKSHTLETAAYWDEVNQPVLVAPEAWPYYSKLGAEKSWLGFPIERSARGSGLQGFEGGRIYWETGSDPAAVRRAVTDLIAQGKELTAKLGLPVTEEQSVGAGESDRIQFFEDGVVTCRNGKYEAWVRPDADRQTDQRRS
jgi:hypothetical protein